MLATLAEPASTLKNCTETFFDSMHSSFSVKLELFCLFFVGIQYIKSLHKNCTKEN